MAIFKIKFKQFNLKVRLRFSVTVQVWLDLGLG